VTDTSALLDVIFSETKEDTREMAVLHYVDGYTLEETAEKMNMSVSGVRKRLSVLRTKALACVTMVMAAFSGLIGIGRR